MGKICAIEGCVSGSNKDVARRKTAGLRQLALFSIPKRNNGLARWSEALRRKLAETDFICEKHFSEDSIIKDDKTVLRDGTMNIIPRQKAMLRVNAVPIAIVNEVSNNITTSSCRPESSNSQALLSTSADSSVSTAATLAHNQTTTANQAYQSAARGFVHLTATQCQMPQSVSNDVAVPSNNNIDVSNINVTVSNNNNRNEACQSWRNIVNDNCNTLAQATPDNHKFHRGGSNNNSQYESTATTNIGSLANNSAPTPNGSGERFSSSASVNSSQIKASSFNDVQETTSSNAVTGLTGAVPCSAFDQRSDSDDSMRSMPQRMFPHAGSGGDHALVNNENRIRTDVFNFADHLMESSEEPSITAVEADASALPEDPWTDVVTPFTIEQLLANLEAKSLMPEAWCWIRHRRNDGSIVFIKLDAYKQLPNLRVRLYNDLSVSIHTIDEKIDMELDIIITSINSLVQLLNNIDKEIICAGTGIQTESRDESCLVFVPYDEYKKHVSEPRCCFCRKLRIQLQNQNNKRKTNLTDRYTRLKRKSTVKQRACKRLRQKAKRLKRLIAEGYERCAVVKKQALQDAISKLDPAQQKTVTACFDNSKVGCATQRRYRIDWVYECLLMRIKNSKLYDHLRSRNILPLPCKDTLNKYTQKLDTSYGFQKSVFDCLRLKASRMEPREKRGTLLIDEMSINAAINFDRKTMRFNGFVDLGEHTPVRMQNERADHALVFMFQPFRGVWIQALGCFLSKNCVTSQILHKLILECLMKLEGSGFRVDVVTMDGAQWNRSVWTLFGVTAEGNFSCQHPCDDNRRLWMMSDFPHLIKCFRNGIMAPKVESFNTPDGTVRKQHWRAVIDHEGRGRPNMKIAFKLTDAHLNPKGYQKMNVPLAFQLFSDRVRVAMDFYKNDPKCPRLKDCAPTIELIKVVDDLIHAMMSRKPSDALRPTETCPQKKAIERFLEFLRAWESGARSEGVPLPISESTLKGLKVTLGATLELLEFLHKQCNFDYLMTARLNQDALERFFGMMRNACGSNDHPDALLFAQVFRLVCSYSLVKPPKGSNVSGEELLETLMQTTESLAASKQTKDDLLTKINAAVDAGRFSVPENPSVVEVADQDHMYLDTQSKSSHSHVSEHDYDVARTSEEVLALVSGYVARRIRDSTKCNECIKRLTAEDPCDRDKVTQLLSRYGGLLYPSEELYKLLNTLETAVLDVVGKLTVKQNTLHQIVEKVSEMKNLPLVGCINHDQEVTVKAVNFYLLMRGSFLANSVNANYDAKKVKTKMLRKQAKL